MNVKLQTIKIIKSTPLIRNVFEYFHFHSQFKKALIGCETILDLGCGSDSSFASVSKNFHSVGVDAFLPAIEESKKKGIHNEYFCMDIMDIDKQFEKDSFDGVLLGDVIEHLDKEQGVMLLEKIENIAKKKIVIFTPNGFLHQGIHYQNPWQEHKSGWSADEMVGRGFKVIGFGGVKSLRTELSKIKYRPYLLWRVISELSELFVRDFPKHAFSILCIKEKANINK